MLKAQAASLLKIRPEEIRMVALVATLFLCMQAGQGIGENAAFGLFLARVDVERLPYMYIGLGGFVFIASLAYATSLGRFHDAKVVTSVLAIAVFVFLSQWVAISLFDLAIYPVLWLTTYGMSVILGTVIWTIAGAVCDARQAKRLFSFFASMGILGSVLGNLLTGIFANVAGTANLIIAYAALLGAGFFLTRKISRSYFQTEATARNYNLIHDMRSGFDFVRQSQLFRLVAISSILYSVLFFTVDFPFSEILSDRFAGSEASLAGFKGLFTSITTAVTFFVSLLLANRLYARLGIIGSILIMPITYVIAFLVFFLSFTFTGAVFVRFSQLVVLGGLMGTAWNALFNVVPPERRGQVLAFNNGVPAQLGVLLSGVMILLSRQVLQTHAILLLGAFVACASVYLTLRMRSAYGDALISALRSGRVEVFSEQEAAFSGYQNNPEALQVVRRALRDAKPAVRRLAVEMSAKMGDAALIPDLIDRLYDDEGNVRAMATRALAELGGVTALSDIILGLDDPDHHVREEALVALSKLGVSASPDLIRTLERLLEAPGVQAHAAMVLIALGESQPSVNLLTQLLADDDVSKRKIVLRAFGRIAAARTEPVNVPVSLFLRAFEDSAATIRRDAARLAYYVPDPAILHPLAQLLKDKDVGVRRAASGSLRQVWAQASTIVMDMLQENDGTIAYAVLDSIPPGNPQITDALHDYMQREVANLQSLRSISDALPRAGKSVSLLVDTLTDRQSKSEERLIKAIGLFGNPRALNLIRKSLNVGNAGTRAAALEALETLGDKKITHEVLPILDRGDVRTKNPLEMGEAIDRLITGKDRWLCALAVRSIPELDSKIAIQTLKTLGTNRDDLIQEAVRDVLWQMESTTMKTLKTLSTLDRILLLREIPMFSKLTVEDLERVAEIAHEQLYLPGTLICREGEAGNTLFIVVSGEVDIVKSSGDAENILARRKMGEFVGEMAILESAPRSASVRAVNDVRVLSIEGDAFNMILLDRPEVAVSVLRNMSARIRELNEKVGRRG